MSENLGTIEYIIKADTAQLLIGGQQVTKVTDQMEGSFKKVDKANESLNTSLTKTASAVSGGLKSGIQQAGYQIQDFIVQIQGGQSALVAFSQQASQLAGAFGPSGAIVGAAIALGSVITGTLIAALNGGKSAIESLKDAAEQMDKVITISQNGVAAYSDKFAALAKTNSAVATLMKRQAELELQSALSKVSKEVQQASSDFITFGDSLVSSLGGGYASVKLFNDYLSTLNITTDKFSDALKQAAASGQSGQTAMNSMIATVGALASKFDLTDQQAYEFAKQLSDIAKNPSDEKLKGLAATLQNVGNGHSAGAQKALEYARRLLEIAGTSADATMRLKALKEMTDSLTSSQDKALQQARQELFITKQTGDEKLKAQAWRDAENEGIKQGTQAFRDYYNVRLATYKQQEANIEAARSERKEQTSAESAARKALSQQNQNAQKLADYKQKAELAADSTQELSREQAMLRAEQSLNDSATKEQIAEIRRYAAAEWDAANAVKQRQQAEQGRKFAQQEIVAAKVMPDAQSGTATDPTAQIDFQEQQKLAALSKYQALDIQNAQLYEDAKTAIQQQAANERKRIAVDEANVQSAAIGSILNSASQGFDSLATMIQNASGKSSGAYVAMFAAAKAFAIAQSTLSLNAAIMQAMADPTALTPAQKLANYAAIASAGASLLSNIASTTMSGGRRYGGTVSAGNAYRINESGESEIFQTAGGKQAFIPNQSGKVIPADKVGGGGVQNVYFTINTTGGISDAEWAQIEAKAVSISKKMALYQISDQANRPGGIIQRRKNG